MPLFRSNDTHAVDPAHGDGCRSTQNAHQAAFSSATTDEGHSQGAAASHARRSEASSPRPSLSKSLIQSCPRFDNEAQRCAGLVLPFWPHTSQAQELALFRLNGVHARDILAELERSVKSSWTSQWSATHNMRAKAQPSSSSVRLPSARVLSHAHTTAEETDHEQDETNMDSSAGTQNKKKRKSSRYGVEGFDFSRDGMSCPHRTQRGSDLSDEGSSYGSDLETTEQQDQERPDVSAPTFRASRVVDELSIDGGDPSDRPEFCQDCLHRTISNVAGGSCCGDFVATDQQRLSASLVPFSHSPWSRRLLCRLRKAARVRALAQLANNKRLGIDLDDTRRNGYRRQGTYSAEATQNSRQGGDDTSSAAPKVRAKKAEKRAIALKGNKGKGQKVTLAEIRARNRGVADSGQADISTRSLAGGGRESAASSHCGHAAFVLPSSITMAKFLVRHDSTSRQQLLESRRFMQDLLTKPFSDVMQALGLPNHADVEAADIFFSMPPQRCPMLHPGADIPIKGYQPGAKVPRDWPRLADGLVFTPQSHGRRQRTFSPHHEKGTVGSPNPQQLWGVTSQTSKGGIVPTCMTIPSVERERQRPSSQELHSHAGERNHQSDYDPLSSTSWIFPNEHICLFCEYELFYGERPRFLKACAHRRRVLRNQRQEKRANAERKGGPSSTLPRKDVLDRTSSHLLTHEENTEASRSRHDGSADADRDSPASQPIRKREATSNTPNAANSIFPDSCVSRKLVNEDASHSFSESSQPNHSNQSAAEEERLGRPNNKTVTSEPLGQDAGLRKTPNGSGTADANTQRPLLRSDSSCCSTPRGARAGLDLGERGTLSQIEESNTAHSNRASSPVTSDSGARANESEWASMQSEDQCFSSPMRSGYMAKSTREYSDAGVDSISPRQLAQSLLQAIDAFTAKSAGSPRHSVWNELNSAREALFRDLYPNSQQ